ncbi:hypothetical protein GCM10023094_34460 [Rhodococcus olei]|uniref:Uncharacterized protein n=1 Tax=Rhodococcus olei TaxID=2161675 RepID=A0ABP8PA52_9NOCA
MRRPTMTDRPTLDHATARPDTTVHPGTPEYDTAPSPRRGRRPRGWPRGGPAAADTGHTRGNPSPDGRLHTAGATKARESPSGAVPTLMCQTRHGHARHRSPRPRELTATTTAIGSKHVIRGMMKE